MMLKSLLVAAACVATALAQSKLAFTSFPSAQQPVGQSVELKWDGGNGSPVTITLRQGDANNLKDVAVLTSSATGNSFTWTPSASLASGSDYALQISQAGSDPNYYGPFALSGGSASASASNSMSVTSSASSVLSSASSALSSASSLLSSITAANATTSTASSLNSTTLSTKSSLSSASATTTSTKAASSTGSSTSSSSSGSATSASTAAGLSSPIALIFGVVAAMLYLN